MSSNLPPDGANQNAASPNQGTLNTAAPQSEANNAAQNRMNTEQQQSEGPESGGDNNKENQRKERRSSITASTTTTNREPLIELRPSDTGFSFTFSKPGNAQAPGPFSKSPLSKEAFNGSTDGACDELYSNDAANQPPAPNSSASQQQQQQQQQQQGQSFHPNAAASGSERGLRDHHRAAARESWPTGFLDEVRAPRILLSSIPPEPERRCANCNDKLKASLFDENHPGKVFCSRHCVEEQAGKDAEEGREGKVANERHGDGDESDGEAGCFSGIKTKTKKWLDERGT